MSQFGSFQSSKFSQRQFEIPVQDEEMDSLSQSSSNQALHQQIMQSQLVPTCQISPIKAETPRRGLLGNVFGSSSRRNIATGPELNTGDETAARAPKRRGPKPDSKPAQNRRQELNRQAQRTHRERKEWYLKELEVQVQALKEAVASSQGAKRALEKQKRAVETEKRAIENENRLLRQLLQANNIPFMASTHMSFSQPLPVSGLLAGNIHSDSNSSVYNSYFDPNDSYNNNLGSGSQPVASGPSPALTDVTSGHTSSLQGSLSTGLIPAYSSENSSPLNFNSQPTTNGDLSMPPPSKSIAPTQYFDDNATGNEYGDIKGLATKDPDQLVPQPFFNNPDDPLFIEFVVDLEENCQDHAGFMFQRLGDNTTEDVSGHALMFTAPTMRQIHDHPGEFKNKAPSHGNADLNSLLARSQEFNRNNEVTPIMAALMIAKDPRFPTLTVAAFKRLQATLKSRSRCYGFGAILEAYEVTQAMDEACTDSDSNTPTST